MAIELGKDFFWPSPRGTSVIYLGNWALGKGKYLNILRTIGYRLPADFDHLRPKCNQGPLLEWEHVEGTWLVQLVEYVT